MRYCVAVGDASDRVGDGTSSGHGTPSVSHTRQRSQVACLRCPKFLPCHITFLRRLMEFSRVLGLDVTFMVFRCLAEITRTVTS